MSSAKVDFQAVGPPFTKRMTLRKRVSSACILCKRSRMRCDDLRPCKRCLRFGNEKLCVLPFKSSNQAENQEHKPYHQLSQIDFQQAASSFDPRYSSWCPVPNQQPTTQQPAFGRQADFRAQETVSLTSNSFQSCQNSIGNAISCEGPPSGPLDRFVPNSLFGPHLSAGTQSALMEQLLTRQRYEILEMISRMASGPVGCPPQLNGVALPSLSSVQAAAAAAAERPSSLCLAPLRLSFDQSSA